MQVRVRIQKTKWRRVVRQDECLDLPRTSDSEPRLAEADRLLNEIDSVLDA